jgi:diguanylate cyclase (GGDEF)-like protein/PAS domain S-box-containing protein
VRRRTPRAAAAERQRFASITDRLFAPVVLLSKTGRIEYLNPAAAAILRQERDWLTGRAADELVHQADRPLLRRLIRDVSAGRPATGPTSLRMRAQPSLDWRVVEWIGNNFLGDPGIGGILVSLRDHTESDAQTRALAEVAFRDELTGLPNRASVVRDLDGLLASDVQLSLALIGIDRLSLIGDLLRGAAAGVVRVVGKRIRAAAPRGTIVGRLENGTFAALFTGRVADDAVAVGWRMADRAREPMFVGGHEIQTSVSVGIARREPDATVDSLLGDAGLALHRAQSKGGSTVEPFTDRLRQEAISRLRLEADLRRAVAERSLALAFQPIVRLPDRSVLGSEALLRWHHSERDVPPAEFIPLAEESGLILPLGEWVVDEAARLASRAPGQRVSVNLSARQLAVPGLPRALARLVDARCDRHAVEFEITETLLIGEWEYTARVLAELRGLGFRVGLDDFGTGYSSLGYLRRLPLDFLKIDRSLIADVDGDKQACSVAAAVIMMAEALDLEVVAEGVERESQLDALLEAGATSAQGHLFGRARELEAAGGSRAADAS